MGEIIVKTSFFDIGDWCVAAKRMAMSLAASLVCLTGSAPAATFDLFLITEHSAPTSNTGSFSVTTETAYQIDLASMSYSLATDFTFDIDGSMEVDSVQIGGRRDGSRTLDMGEAGQGDVSYTQSEIDTWDNVNLAGNLQTGDPDYEVPYTVTNGYDATEQIDFGRASTVTLAAPTEGFVDLVFAEMNAYNPFNLYLCSKADCSTDTGGIADLIFGGFNSSLTNSLLALADLAISDLEAIGQTWLFRFDQAIFDYVRIQEDDTRSVYLNNRLQMDYIGYAGAGTPPPSDVPLPGGLPLVAGALGLFALLRRKSSI